MPEASDKLREEDAIKRFCSFDTSLNFFWFLVVSNNFRLMTIYLFVCKKRKLIQMGYGIVFFKSLFLRIYIYRLLTKEIYECSFQLY